MLLWIPYVIAPPLSNRRERDVSVALLLALAVAVGRRRLLLFRLQHIAGVNRLRCGDGTRRIAVEIDALGPGLAFCR